MGDNPPDSPALDRGDLTTEQRLTASAAVDAMSTEQILRLMNTQDTQVPQVVRHAIPAITGVTDRVVASLHRGGRLIYVGAGSSGRLGVLDAVECPPTFHSDPEQVIGLIAGGDEGLKRAVEGAEDDEATGRAAIEHLAVGENDVVLGIAAGGTTPFVWSALAAGGEAGAATGLITCVPLKQLRQRKRAQTVPPNAPTPAVPAATLPARVDHPIELLVGPEVVTGSTRLKAGTATKLALNMISTAAFIQQGKVWGNLMVDLQATNQKLRDRAIRMLREQAELDRDAAARVLDRAEDEVKVAIVMARLNVSAEDARQRLHNHAGRLRPIVGAPAHR
jgi:N-acetylmuramic acid 6-phosphate etherase